MQDKSSIDKTNKERIIEVQNGPEYELQVKN